jgi:UDP-N-acetylglucosamine--N-acetylmuramyl-(pentapeptide) pyrophosphoryl-undecaprenol N-acetylglucosamine transferase
MTGGGVYPALAVLQALENKTDSVLWVGSRSGMEANLLSRYQFPYTSISAAGMHGIDLKRLPKNSLELINGWRESRAILKQFNPDVIFYTGGYVGVPMAIAARKIPSVVFIPDIEPGFALKIITRLTNSIAVSTRASLPFIHRKELVRITGYPLRKEIKEWTQKKGRNHFNIPENAKALFVYGGSKGARSINQALTPILGKLLDHMHVIHLTGEDNWEDFQKDPNVRKSLKSQKYHLFPFLHADMGAAFSAADLVVCRAGASTIGELPFFGLPAILIPYPHAWRYQYQNATFLATNGGAEIIRDENLSHELFGKIMQIFNDEKKINLMKKKMQLISVEGASHSIAKQILEVGQAMREGGGEK